MRALTAVVSSTDTDSKLTAELQTSESERIRLQTELEAMPERAAAFEQKTNDLRRTSQLSTSDLQYQLRSVTQKLCDRETEFQQTLNAERAKFEAALKAVSAPTPSDCTSAECARVKSELDALKSQFDRIRFGMDVTRTSLVVVTALIVRLVLVMRCFWYCSDGRCVTTIKAAVRKAKVIC